MLLFTSARLQQMIDVRAVTVLRTSSLGTTPISPLVSFTSSALSQLIGQLFLKLLLLSGRKPPQCLTHLS